MAKIYRIIFLVTTFQLPVGLLYFDIIDYKHRYLLMGLSMVLLTLYTLKSKFNLMDLGIRLDNIKRSIICNLLYSLLIVVVLLLLYLLDLIREPTIPDWDLFFVFYVFVSSPTQEFLFRSLVFAELRLLKLNIFWQISLSTINYALMHSFYHDWITFICALSVGICLGWIYARTNNLIGVSIAHAIIGAVSIYVGLV